MSTHTADSADLFPSLPRNTVVKTVRDEWNELRAAMRDLGGVISAPHAAVVLGISRQRVHELLASGQIRSVQSEYFLYVSAADVQERLAHPRPAHRPARKP